MTPVVRVCLCLWTTSPGYTCIFFYEQSFLLQIYIVILLFSMAVISGNCKQPPVMCCLQIVPSEIYLVAATGTSRTCILFAAVIHYRQKYCQSVSQPPRLITYHFLCTVILCIHLKYMWKWSWRKQQEGEVNFMAWLFRKLVCCLCGWLFPSCSFV